VCFPLRSYSLRITRLNVYAGLAGLYVIDDERREALFADKGLPHFGDERDIPLAFADRHFTYEPADGAGEDSHAHLIYPTGTSDADGGVSFCLLGHE